MKFNKRDKIEPEIVDALERCGFMVRGVEREPYDLVVGRNGATYLLECKGPKAPLKPSQVAFRASWTGHYAIVRSVEEALIAVGVKGQDSVA